MKGTRQLLPIVFGSLVFRARDIGPVYDEIFGIFGGDVLFGILVSRRDAEPAEDREIQVPV
jgi:hypothetical protein